MAIRHGVSFLKLAMYAACWNHVVVRVQLSSRSQVSCGWNRDNWLDYRMTAYILKIQQNASILRRVQTLESPQLNSSSLSKSCSRSKGVLLRPWPHIIGHVVRVDFSCRIRGVYTNYRSTPVVGSAATHVPTISSKSIADVKRWRVVLRRKRDLV